MRTSIYLTQFQSDVNKICNDSNFDSSQAEVKLKKLFESFKNDVKPIRHKTQLIDQAQKIFDHAMGNLDRIAESHREQDQINPDSKV